MTNLILHVTPELQITEGALRVAFFDKEIIKFKENEDIDAPKEELSRAMVLCIRIENKEDRYTTINRPAKKLRLKGDYGDIYFKEETAIYKNAYKRYLELKSQPNSNPTSELEVARKRIAELEAASTVASVITQDTRTASEIKVELEALGIEYKGNASRDSLLILLNK